MNEELILGNDKVSLVLRLENKNLVTANEDEAIVNATISNGETFAYGVKLSKSDVKKMKRWLSDILYDDERVAVNRALLESKSALMGFDAGRKIIKALEAIEKQNNNEQVTL